MTTIIGIPAAFQKPQYELGKGASAVPQSYLRALEIAGGAPLLIPITGQERTLRALYRHIDGLLLAGGVDIDPAHFDEPHHPKLGKIDTQRDWTELTLTPWAIADGMPILGICRGVQTINVAAGGTLWQDIEAQVPDSLRHPWYPDYPFNRLSHQVQLEPGSRLAELIGAVETKVNSLHHQAVKDVGAGLRATAQSADGIIEAIESTNGSWVLGVQWHPEWLIDDNPGMLRLFESFIAASEEYRNGQKGR